MEKWIWNFIWTGDTQRQGLMTVNWTWVCAQKSFGGLQVTNILVENKAFLLRLAWDFVCSVLSWTEMMKKWFLKCK